jgi:PAS domain S-box-containing protein
VSDQRQLLFETMLQGVVFQDADGRIVAMNPAAERILGKGPSDFIGQTSVTVERDSIHEDGSPFPGVEHPSMVALRTGHEQHGVVMGVFNPRENGYRWISISAVPLFRPGEVLPFQTYTIFDDITAKKRMEQELVESQAQLRTIVDNVNEGLVVCDLGGRVLHWNRAALDMHGFSLQKDRRPFSELAAFFELSSTDGKILPVEDWPIARILRGETLRDLEIHVRHLRAGWSRIFSYGGALARDASGRSLLGVVTMSDVTERKRAEEVLRNQYSTLRGIIDSTDAIVFSVDREYRYTSANKAHQTMMKSLYGADIAIGASLLDRMTVKEDREKARRNLDRALAGENVVEEAYSGESLRTRSCFRVSHSPIRTESGDVIGVAVLAQDVTEWKRLEDAILATERERALHESEARFRALIENSSDMILLLNREGALQFWSPGATAMLGWTAQEVHGRSVLELAHPEEEREARMVFLGILGERGGTARSVLRLRHKDGTWRFVESVTRNLVEDPAVSGIVVNSRDVTEQLRLQEQLLESRKLESVGRLAGGVAHDFNNLLTAILGGADALKDDLANDRRIELEDVEAIRDAGDRARQLTRQLLAFARKQVIAPAPIDTTAFVRENERLLSRLLPENIRLATDLAPGTWLVLCDVGQLQQVLLNLAVNARDAMPAGGLLTIQTRNVTLDEGAARSLGGTRAGEYIRFTVRDSGMGLSPEAKAHLFEPFFTTKPIGRGTGLGLAAVYGIVKQSDGFLTVESEPGRGTAFHVHLPRTERPVETPPSAFAGPSGGTETVLLTEDEPLVRAVAARALRRGGYRTLVAANAKEALDQAATFGGVIDLLVTDVVMPDMNGHELAKELLRARPTLRVLYISGYATDGIADRGVLDPGVELLSKPFTAGSLLARVRAVLDAWTAKR